MTGAVVSTTVTVWLHWAVLVTVLRMVMVAVPLLSVAVGASKVQAVPNCTVLLVFFFNDTAATEIYTLSLHDVLPILLVHASVACQVRVASKVLPQWPAVLVTVLRMVIVAVPLLSVALGASKVQAVPN